MTLQLRVLLAEERAAGFEPLRTGTVNDAIVATRKAPGVTACISTLGLPTAFRIADRLASCVTGTSDRIVSCRGTCIDVKNCRPGSSEHTVDAGEGRL
jgi:ABC-type transporter Mla maintaining outer membrane lipid asymmetry ATPase subunit MlaF